MYTLRIHVYDEQHRYIYDLDESIRKEWILYEDEEVNILAVCKMSNWYFEIQGDEEKYVDLNHRKIEDGFCYVVYNQVKLEVHSLSKEQLSFDTYRLEEKTLWIGRDTSVDFCIPSVHVSKFHACLYHTQDGWMIEDEHSTNGTYVNGDKVQKQRLHCKDTIHIGDVMFIMGMDTILAPKNIFSTCSKELHMDLEGVRLQKKVTAVQYPLNSYPKETIEVELPLAKGSQEAMPLLYILGPSITMEYLHPLWVCFPFGLRVYKNKI